jgi:uncharacterized protein YndB with AHSA1/START domain
MVERQVVLPAPRSEVWTALTDPEQVAAWFGAEVDWELRPGGPAQFSGDDGSRREGVVEVVADRAELRFTWWPADGDDEPPTQVTYTLEDDDDGTRLTVTEQPLDEAVPTTCSVAVRGGVDSRWGEWASRWGEWDSRLAGLWIQASAERVSALA